MLEVEISILHAKPFSNHFVQVGCGQLGNRLCTLLLDIGIPFILIVLKEDLEENEFLEELCQQKVPVIVGDASMKEILSLAQIENAHAIIISVRDDLLNYKIALRAKQMVPPIRVIAHIFDEVMATALKESGYVDEVFSTTVIAVKPFILGSMVDVVTEMPSPILVRVTPDILRIRKSKADLEKDLGVNILALYRDGTWIYDRECQVRVDDVLCIQTFAHQLSRLLKTVLPKSKRI